MGNQLYNNNNREYDIIFHVESLMDIDIGWPIKFQNPLLKELYQPEKAENSIDKNPLKANVKWDSEIVSIQGKNRSGKTFLLNLLGEFEIPYSTKGISMKMLKINERKMVILETGGIERPIVPMPTKECNMQIEEQKGTENVLRDISISSSDLNILVTENFSHQDHSLLIKISNTLVQKIKKENDLKKSKNKKYVQTRPEILIVHNFKNESYDDALVKWKSYVKEISKYQPVFVSSYKDNLKEPNYDNCFPKENFMAHKMETTEEIDGEEITFIHVFFCKHQEGAFQYNLLVTDEIKSWLTDGPPQKEIIINPLGYFSTMSEINLTNYITGMDKMGMYYLTDQLSLFYIFLNNPCAFNSSFPNTPNYETKLLKENMERFYLEFEKEATTHMSLLETKNIHKWTVNQCEQLREWMLTSREKKINGIPFEFFPRLYRIKWEEYVENMWKRNLDYIILYAISQVLKYRVVILTSNPTNPIFVFTPEKEKASKETLFFSLVRFDSEVYYSKLVCKEQLVKKHILDVSDRESKIKKFSQVENFLTFRSNENSNEKKLFGGKSVLKSNFVSSNLSASFDFSQQFSVKYTTEINKKDDSMRIVIDVPYSSNDYLEYDCTLLYEPKRFKLEVKGKRELEDEWVVSEGTRKFGDWTFNYEIPKQYTIEQPEVEYKDGVLIFSFKHGEVLSTAKKIIKKSK